MTQATLTRTAADPAERIAAGLADVFGAVSPEQVEFIQRQAERVSVEAEALMPRDLDGMTSGTGPIPRTPTSLACNPLVLAASQVLARELHATTEAQFAWVQSAAEGVWSEVMSEMPGPFED
jgi:hypothetical protein